MQSTMANQYSFDLLLQSPLIFLHRTFSDHVKRLQGDMSKVSCNWGEVQLVEELLKDRLQQVEKLNLVEEVLV